MEASAPVTAQTLLGEFLYLAWKGQGKFQPKLCIQPINFDSNLFLSRKDAAHKACVAWGGFRSSKLA